MLFSQKENVKADFITIKECFMMSFYLSQTAFQRDLEKDVVSETSGHFRRLLVSMVQAARDETTNVDMNKAKADAKVINVSKMLQRAFPRWLSSQRERTS